MTTKEFDIWLEGAPVIVFPVGNEFNIWLEGAPYVDTGPGEDATAVVTGTEVLVETGVVTAIGGAVATVIGTEIQTQTGNVTAEQFFIAIIEGVEIQLETGTVTANGGKPIFKLIAFRRATSWPPFLKNKTSWTAGLRGQKWKGKIT